MKSVYVNAPGENWIVDRLAEEWRKHNPEISVTDPRQADIIWLLSDWTWERERPRIESRHKVVTTIHHIVPSKFDRFEKQNFSERNEYTHVYHVPNRHTEAFIKPLVGEKPIHVIPYWANDLLWTKSSESRNELRKKYGIDSDAYVVGSFQRDSEGNSILTNPQPKLEKGPDLFVNYVESLQTKHPNLVVLIAGWRRHYVRNELEKRNIKYVDFSRERALPMPTGDGYIRLIEGDPKFATYKGELPSLAHLNESGMVTEQLLCELYQCCDLYPITARYEGGPQSFIECGLLNVKVVSRDVGISHEVMSDISIFDRDHEVIPTVPMIDHLRISTGQGFEPYRKLFESL